MSNKGECDSGNGETDRCPFCNAVWGRCLHVKLLIELDNEAASRLDSKPSASTPSVVDVNISVKDTFLPEEGNVVPLKPNSASR